MSIDVTALQRHVTRLALEALDGHSFALAGSGAIREHGFIQRLSRDVDLFSNDASSFSAAVDALGTALAARGYGVDQVRRTESFAQLRITTSAGDAVDVDLGVDWRSNDPVSLQVGPVLSIDDAVASKVGAIYSRTEARDFIDVDAIRCSLQFTDERLLALVGNRDPGFDADMFAQQIGQVVRIRDARFHEYGTAGDDLEALRARFLDWAYQISSRHGSGRLP